MPAGKGKRAAPVAKCDEVIDRIIEGVEAGQTVTAACESEGVIPRSFYRWVENDPALQSRFARAREAGFDVIADEALRIADEPSKTKLEVADRRTRIDTRFRLLAKWDPKRYGDRLQTAQTDVEGNDVRPPLDMTDVRAVAGLLIEIFDRARARRRDELRLGGDSSEIELKPLSEDGRDLA
jgi:hypothetical protein